MGTRERINFEEIGMFMACPDVFFGNPAFVFHGIACCVALLCILFMMQQRESSIVRREFFTHVCRFTIHVHKSATQQAMPQAMQPGSKLSYIIPCFLKNIATSFALANFF